MSFIPRAESLQHLWAQVAKGTPIIGAGAGTGISAKFSERDGVDITIIYNTNNERNSNRQFIALITDS